MDDIPFDIIVGRNLMKKLRYRIIKLEREYVEHKSTRQFITQQDDEIFYDKLLLIPNSTQINHIKGLKHQINFINHHINYVQNQTNYPRPIDIDKLRTYQAQQELKILSVDTKEKVNTDIICGKITNKTVRNKFYDLINQQNQLLQNIGLIVV